MDFTVVAVVVVLAAVAAVAVPLPAAAVLPTLALQRCCFFAVPLSISAVFMGVSTSPVVQALALSSWVFLLRRSSKH